ncbi:hypothetical protein [Nocardioides ochotonae]|nr:hypothetical protein [Nocardioides ochotonae]
MTDVDLQTRLRRELDATEPPLRLDLVSLRRVARARRRRRRAAAAVIGAAASVSLVGALALPLGGGGTQADDLVATDPNTGVTPDPPSTRGPVASPDDPRVVALGSGTGVGDRGSRTVQLGPRPPEASAVIVSVTCLTAGTVRYAGIGAISCSAGTSATTDVLIRLEPGQESIRIRAREDVEWELSATYARIRLEKP